MQSNHKIVLAVFVAVLLFQLTGASEEASAAETSRKSKAMREKVYERLSRAQEATEAENWQEAFDQLKQLEKMRDLAPHEKAQMYTAYGYTYFAQENYVESVAAYEKVLLQEELADPMRLSTLYTLGQLNFHLDKFEAAASNLESWLDVATNPGPEPYILLGQAYYQLGRLDEATAPIKQAIKVAEQRDQKVKENWYALLRVIYFETKDYENLLDVLEILVLQYPSKEYWIHLSSAYGEMGDTRRQLAAYEMVYAQGYLKTSSEIVVLCQLLMQSEVPYRAGVLLKEGLDSGNIDSTASNWRLLSQAWILAQENDAAIESLKMAAKLSDDGELYARIAQTYANMNQWELSAGAAQTALDKGVKSPQELQLLQGMAYFELGRFPESKAAFGNALKSDKGRETASRWLAYVEREEERIKELEISP